MPLSSQLISSKTASDVEFEWFLCLAATPQAIRRQQARRESTAFLATRSESSKPKHDTNYDRLLALMRELQTHMISAGRKPKIPAQSDRRRAPLRQQPR